MKRAVALLALAALLAGAPLASADSARAAANRSRAALVFGTLLALAGAAFVVAGGVALANNPAAACLSPTMTGTGGRTGTVVTWCGVTPTSLLSGGISAGVLGLGLLLMGLSEASAAVPSRLTLAPSVLVVNGRDVRGAGLELSLAY